MKNYPNLTRAIHREGYVFILICAVVTIFLSGFNAHLFWIGLLSTTFCIFFFRNPERVTPVDANLIIAPGDGVIVNISEATPPQELGIPELRRKISIFLSPFNVHVNRVPVSGKVVKLHYHAGKFVNASLDKASIHNERQSINIERQNGEQVCVIQIAGLIARRIVCDLEEGMEVKAGARFGIIRFGSRVDIYLPLSYCITAAVGQTCVGGETILADAGDNDHQVKYKFEVR